MVVAETVDAYATVDPSELVVRPPFSELFLIDVRTQLRISDSMKSNGYDPSKPINVWRQENVVVDGHTRRLSAIGIGLSQVPVCFHDFDDEDAAMRYAVANQRDRRNLSQAELLRCVQAVDKRKRHGGDGNERGNRFKSRITPNGVIQEKPGDHWNRTSDATAEIVGISPRQVERIRSILDFADVDPTPKEDVLTGKASIGMAANTVAAKKRAKKPTVFHDPVIPKPRPIQEKAKESSLAKTTTEESAWLESLPLRAKVVAHRFDEDALLFRRIESELRHIKSAIREVSGERSLAGMSILHRALSKSIKAQGIEFWTVCQKCKGSGKDNGICKSCQGGGYLIPGI